jgi:hypothetical protein
VRTLRGERTDKGVSHFAESTEHALCSSIFLGRYAGAIGTRPDLYTGESGPSEMETTSAIQRFTLAGKPRGGVTIGAGTATFWP